MHPKLRTKSPQQYRKQQTINLITHGGAGW